MLRSTRNIFLIYAVACSLFLGETEAGDFEVLRDTLGTDISQNEIWRYLKKDQIERVFFRDRDRAATQFYASPQHGMSELQRHLNSVEFHLSSLSDPLSKVIEGMQVYGEIDVKAVKAYSARSYSLSSSFGYSEGIFLLFERDISLGRIILTPQQSQWFLSRRNWHRNAYALWSNFNEDIIAATGG